MERSFIVRPLQTWWITYKEKYMLAIKQETIESLGWEPGQPVEITVEDGKIIIKKLDKSTIT
jgi:bifunctional DNA-binding transcriptional regulator/antitoxin component of YhaV-PrlF toxin-antitoxin module